MYYTVLRNVKWLICILPEKDGCEYLAKPWVDGHVCMHGSPIDGWINGYAKDALRSVIEQIDVIQGPPTVEEKPRRLYRGGM
jgi:hypothetical protein